MRGGGWGLSPLLVPLLCMILEGFVRAPHPAHHFCLPHQPASPEDRSPSRNELCSNRIVVRDFDGAKVKVLPPRYVRTNNSQEEQLRAASVAAAVGFTPFPTDADGFALRRV